jgi:hypothetical protein
MDTKVALIIAGVLGTALLATAIYVLVDGSRFVLRCGTTAARSTALFFVAACAGSMRARGPIGIKFGRR